MRFPHWHPGWVVFEDDDLLVIDKPAGVSSQAADPTRPDDAPTRVSRLLEQKGRDTYLGVHQRLDRDTSGLVLFTRRREANPAIAKQFEGRAVKKIYVACVEHWRGKGSVTELRHQLQKGSDGRMAVVRRGGQEAVTRVRVRRQVGARFMLELELVTGRMHQARVQLAAAGSPIAGDVLYGGALAPRLMLHATRLDLRHPSSGRPLALEAHPPRALVQWLDEGDSGEQIFDQPEALQDAIDLACHRRYGLAHSSGERATNAYRLIHEAGDALPGLAVDVYGDHLVAQLYGDDGIWADQSRRDRVFDALHKLGFAGLYMKVRPKQANVIVDSRREAFSPKLPLRGEAAPDEFTVLEEGVPYRVRLADGLSTGLFLDQRANRLRVRELSAGKRVLNLFSYVCGFTVAAAKGGAVETSSVDASLAILERGRDNLRHAGLLEAGKHQFFAEDAFRWLARAVKKGDRYDVVILDPPSYSSTKSHRFMADKNYTALAADALRCLAPGGTLLAFTNHRGVSQGKFRKMIAAALREANVEAEQLKDLPEPADFPAPLGGECHLKGVMVRLNALL
jgi:23S rRNA (cytosine1962-C5)-methyltransferase